MSNGAEKKSTEKARRVESPINSIARKANRQTMENPGKSGAVAVAQSEQHEVARIARPEVSGLPWRAHFAISLHGHFAIALAERSSNGPAISTIVSARTRADTDALKRPGRKNADMRTKRFMDTRVRTLHASARAPNFCRE